MAEQTETCVHCGHEKYRHTNKGSSRRGEGGPCYKWDDVNAIFCPCAYFDPAPAPASTTPKCVHCEGVADDSPCPERSNQLTPLPHVPASTTPAPPEREQEAAERVISAMLAIPASMEPLELAEAAAHCLALDLLAAEARVAELEGALRVADDEVSYVAGELRGLMANLCGKWRNKCGEWIVRELSVSRPAQNGEDAQNG